MKQTGEVWIWRKIFHTYSLASDYETDDSMLLTLEPGAWFDVILKHATVVAFDTSIQTIKWAKTNKQTNKQTSKQAMCILTGVCLWLSVYLLSGCVLLTDDTGNVLLLNTYWRFWWTPIQMICSTWRFMNPTFLYKKKGKSRLHKE